MKRYIPLLKALCLGAALGAISKYLDTISDDGTKIAAVMNYFADMFTQTGIWVLLAVIIAVGSSTYLYAAGNVLSFFVGMLVVYYIYSAVLFGFFPTRYFVFWGVLGLLGAVGAPLLWLGKHHVKCAKVLPALPM